jgi:metallophosphoesterase superfamily enzyme
MSRVHGDWLLTAQRAAVHVPTRTAVIADLHLGYDLTRIRGGEAVPVIGLGQSVAPLRAAFTEHAVRNLVVAGDLFESAAGHAVVEELLSWLRGVGVALAGIVPGNHDRDLGRHKPGLPVFPDGVELGRWRVVHGDGTLPGGPVVLGHFHPCMRPAGGIAAACYLVGASRIVLPAFSADAAGVNVLGRRQWHAYHCHAIAGDRVLNFGALARIQRKSNK